MSFWHSESPFNSEYGNKYIKTMTIKDLREILIHLQDKKYDDYEVVLWDYNQQQELCWGFGYSLSHPQKKLNFPVDVPTVDGETIMERLKKLKNDLEG